MDIKKSCRDIGELNPLAQEACRLFLSECKKQGINIFITETYRPQERQNYLYAQGRSNPGRVVTWTRKSNHTGRMAWDIACNPPQQLYDGKVLAKAGDVAKKLGITWGGIWHQPDGPHFEITNRWVNPIKNKKEVYKVEKTKIKLNGKIKEVESVEINGFNYIKIRDLQDDKISIEYSKIDKIPIVNVK